MTGWEGWCDSLIMQTDMEAAIVGHEPGIESVWASKPQGGQFAGITVAEIKMLVGIDRSPLFSGALKVGGVKCTALRDTLMVDEEPKTLDLKTKVYEGQSETFNISIAKTRTALVICKGEKDTHGGILNQKVCVTARLLIQNGY